MFEVLKKYNCDAFTEVNGDARRDLFKAMQSCTYKIENTDFASLEGAQFKFKYLAKTVNNNCDIGIKVYHGTKKTFEFEVLEQTEIEVLNKGSFKINTLVQPKEDDVDNKSYFMTMIFIKARKNPKYVFSFSIVGGEEEGYEHRKVFASHTSTGTGGSGRD